MERAKIERLRRIVNAPDLDERLAAVEAEMAEAVERDRAGLPPIPSGDHLRDHVIAEHVRRDREARGEAA